MISKVYEALRHINTIHPTVVKVHYDLKGFWSYEDKFGIPVNFNGVENIDLLHAAAYTVKSLPKVFYL